MRSDMGCSVMLYHMSDFFAEVWPSPEDSQVAFLHGFESKKLLEPYLDITNLEE